LGKRGVLFFLSFCADYSDFSKSKRVIKNVTEPPLALLFHTI